MSGIVGQCSRRARDHRISAQPSRDVVIGMAAEQDAARRRAIERQSGADANAGLDIMLGFSARDEERLIVIEHRQRNRLGDFVAGALK